MKYYIDAFRRYADFSGKSTVTEYWMFILMNFVLSCAFSIVMSIAAVAIGPEVLAAAYAICGIYSLVIIIPNLAIIVRRLRDAGKDWAWIFISFIPFIGAIWLIILLCQPSVEQNGEITE